MRQEIELKLTPKQASSEELYKPIIAKMLKIEEKSITYLRILRKSIDARKGNVVVNLQMLVVYSEPTPKHSEFEPHFDFPDVHQRQRVIVVGSGPAGLFAALRLIELNLKPIVIERGKQVQERKCDIDLLENNEKMTPESNYCFGEGGAGTFSDGKLYTRSHKRGNVDKIFKLLRFHGANEEIMYDSHPHIGTDKLPEIIVNIRKTIEKAGGEVHFNTKVTDFIIENEKIKGVVCGNKEFLGEAVILATGHSARDIYELLHQKQVLLEAKGFAVGIRIEHPQELIDAIQYNSTSSNKYLPAASYKLVTQIEGRGVYSFCMCPGGYIVPAATGEKEIVVNGMSPSERNSPFANSGIVVEVRYEDLTDYHQYGALAGLRFQQYIENLAFNNGGHGLEAPAQRMHDFVNGKLTPTLPEVSYKPGIVSSPIHFWLPEIISSRLQKAFEVFGKTMNGYLTNEAVVLGVESRTSTPVKIPRHPETLQHVQISGLYPCGEGAGYAGGIASSALDGERCASMIALWLRNKL